ncbi:MAG: porin, partial [bacterium]
MQQHQQSTFVARAIRLTGSSKMTDKISALITIEAAKEPNLLDAYVDFVANPRLVIRSGQFQMPFGLETQASRFDQEAVENSLIINEIWKNVYGGYSRDVGVMATARHKVFELKVAAVNGVGCNYGDESSTFFPKWGKDNDGHMDIVGRFGLGIPVFAGLGVSRYQGSWPADEDTSDVTKWVDMDRTATGFDMYLDAGKALFQMEYIRGEGLPGSQWTRDGDSSDPVSFGGWYVLVGFRVTPLIEPVFKYDKYDPNTDEDDDGRSDICLGLNLNFEGKARLQTCYRIKREESDDADVENNQLIVQMSGKF